MTKTCMVEGCTRKHSAKGYCNTHYSRFVYMQRPGKREMNRASQLAAQRRRREGARKEPRPLVICTFGMCNRPIENEQHKLCHKHMVKRRRWGYV